MRLLFNQDQLTRTMTRAQWKVLHRWRRVTEKRLSDEMDKKIQLFRHPAFADLPERLRNGMLDEIINPPIMTIPLAAKAAGIRVYRPLYGVLTPIAEVWRE